MLTAFKYISLGWAFTIIESLLISKNLPCCWFFLIRSCKRIGQSIYRLIHVRLYRQNSVFGNTFKISFVRYNVLFKFYYLILCPITTFKSVIRF